MNKEQNIIHILKRITRDIEFAGKQRLAACIVSGNKILAFGHNKNKTHPLQTRFAKNNHAIFLHAEIDVIKNALKDNSSDILEGTILYIARTKKNGSEGIARPCEGCMRAIEAFGISKVVYTTDIENTYGQLDRAG